MDISLPLSLLVISFLVYRFLKKKRNRLKEEIVTNNTEFVVPPSIEKDNLEIKNKNLIQKNDSFQKGEEFEQYTRDYLFPKDRFDLLERTHSYETNKDDYVESSLKPDFKFRCKESKIEFWVEVKFRKGKLYQNKLEWCSKRQYYRYLKTNETESPVIICLGVKGQASNPEKIFLFPIKKIKYNTVYLSTIKPYEFYTKKPVFSSHLEKLLAK